MKASGGLIAVIGIVLLVLAAVRHFVSNAFMGAFPHLALYLGVVGIVLLVLGLFMTQRTAKN